MKVIHIRHTLITHRLYGRHRWDYLPDTKQFRGGAPDNNPVYLRVGAAVRAVKHLQVGELTWGTTVRNLQELAQYPSCVGDKLRGLDELASVLLRHPLKNRSLYRQLEASVASLEEIRRQEQTGSHRQAAALALQAIKQAASLLVDRGVNPLVQLVPGHNQPSVKSHVTNYTAADIDRVERSWANFRGFTYAACSDCGAIANVLAGGHMFQCECGGGFSPGMGPTCFIGKTPDYGPDLETIDRGLHASCDKSCTYCHGTIRLAEVA